MQLTYAGMLSNRGKRMANRLVGHFHWFVIGGTLVGTRITRLRLSSNRSFAPASTIKLTGRWAILTNFSVRTLPRARRSVAREMLKALPKTLFVTQVQSSPDENFLPMPGNGHARPSPLSKNVIRCISARC
jgi:hypothetical protein